MLSLEIKTIYGKLVSVRAVASFSKVIRQTPQTLCYFLQETEFLVSITFSHN